MPIFTSAVPKFHKISVSKADSYRKEIFLYQIFIHKKDFLKSLHLNFITGIFNPESKTKHCVLS